MFKKVKERINKTKGGNEVEAIYQKYLDLISKEFAKTAKVEFGTVNWSNGLDICPDTLYLESK